MQNGGPGSTSGAFLRGANRGQTLVLIDGLRVGSSSVGATSLEAIPLDQIDRIEILRGPASSLYGADAIGGVDPGVHQAAAGHVVRAERVRRLRHLRHAQRRARGLRGTIGSAARSRCRRAARAATASTRSSIRTTSATTPTATAIRRENVGANAALDVGAGAGARRRSTSATGSTTSSTAARRTSTIARSRRCEAWSVASRNRISDALDVAADRRRGQRRLRVADGFGDFAVQDDAAPVHLAERSRRCRWARCRVDPRAARGAPRHRRRVRGDRSATPIRRPASTSCATTRSRCRPTCAATIRTSTAARRPAASRSATSSRRRGA